MQRVSILEPGSVSLSAEAEPWLISLTGPIFPIIISGVSRSGKSDLASHLVHLLSAADNFYPVFRSGPGWDPITTGVEGVAIHRPAGGYWIVIDTETIDRPNILGLLGRISSLMIIVETALSNQLIDYIADLICSTMVLHDHDQWHDLHLVFNMSRFPVTGTDLDSLLDRNLTGSRHDQVQVIRSVYGNNILVTKLPSDTDYVPHLHSLHEQILSLTRPSAIDGINLLLVIRSLIPSPDRPPDSVIFDHIIKLSTECKQLADDLLTEFITSNDLPRDGRITDTEIQSRHSQLSASFLQRYDDQVLHNTPSPIITRHRHELISNVTDHLSDLISDNQSARAIMSSSEETITSQTGEHRTYHQGHFNCTVTTTVRRRVQHQHANGDCSYTPWTSTTSVTVTTRPDHAGTSIGFQLLCANGAKAALEEGQMLIGEGERRSYQLKMQLDGNLVLYDAGRALWSTETHFQGQGPYRLVVDSAVGEVVLYGYNNGRLWGIGPYGPGSYDFKLQSDRNLVFYKDGCPVWATGTD